MRKVGGLNFWQQKCQRKRCHLFTILRGPCFFNIVYALLIIHTGYLAIQERKLKNLKIVEFQPNILPYSFGIGFRGRCIQGVTSLKGVHRLTRATGSNSVYQCMEIIPFSVSTNAALF